MNTKHGIIKYSPSYTERYYEDVLASIDGVLANTILWHKDEKRFKTDLSSELTEYYLLRQYIDDTTAEMQETVSELYNLYNDYLVFPEDYDYVENDIDYFAGVEHSATKDQIEEYNKHYHSYVESLAKHHERLCKNVKRYLEVYFDILHKRASFIDYGI